MLNIKHKFSMFIVFKDAGYIKIDNARHFIDDKDNNQIIISYIKYKDESKQDQCDEYVKIINKNKILLYAIACCTNKIYKKNSIDAHCLFSLTNDNPVLHEITRVNKDKDKSTILHIHNVIKIYKTSNKLIAHIPIIERNHPSKYTDILYIFPINNVYSYEWNWWLNKDMDVNTFNQSITVDESIKQIFEEE